MRRGPFCALVALTLAALHASAAGQPLPSPPPKWTTVATVREADESVVEVWSIRAGSIGRREDGELFAVVEVAKTTDKPQTSPIYYVVVNAKHCGSKYGDISVTTLDGKSVSSGVYTRGSPTVAAHVAAYLCRVGGSK